MGLISTQLAGFGNPKPDQKQLADPKPVTGFDYAGQPMRDPNAYYNGRPEHMDPSATLANPDPSNTIAADSAALPSDSTASGAFSGAPEIGTVSPTTRGKDRSEKVREGLKRYWEKRRKQAQTEP